jgi:molybdopterin/thiamine biosynthesis adenylyltransferase
MKATLEFNLPEEEQEHRCALAGVDALLVIDDVVEELANGMNNQYGVFKECDIETLERVIEYIVAAKEERKLPNLI